MGLQLPPRVAKPRSVIKQSRRLTLGVLLGLSLLVLTGCSTEDILQFRWAMPDPATEQGPHILQLWQWAWIAAMIVGVIVWALIFWVMWAYRRRSAEDIPVQTRYNLPLEVFYTVAPVMMVIVFFFWTVNVQNEVLNEVDDPDVTVEVVGQQWSWTFNHATGSEIPGVKEREEETGHPEPWFDEYAFTVGTARDIPTLVLPVDRTVHFRLWSPDVIHSFWIPGFLMKMDIVPGRVNSFQVTPNREGTFKGKCAELCGVYHSRMLFNVEVVSQAEYDAYLADLEARGNSSATPLLGGADAYEQAGLESDENGDHE